MLDRRDFLWATGGLTAWGLLSPSNLAHANTPRKRVLRLAHLTDSHVQPEFRAPEGLTACLHHVNSQQDRPDLILMGGDHIMDAFRRTRERTSLQWKIWQSVTAAENSIPIHSCLGNHDIWGWNKVDSQTTGQEPEHGKQWACDVLGLAKPYYSFDQAGWHFIALDSVQPSPYHNEFSAFLDDAQLDWLEKDLAQTPKTTPILIWSHIPIVSAVAQHLAARETVHDMSQMEAGHVHADSHKLVALFQKHPNLKACLSGHLHRIERIELKGISYYCNGSICGKWWRGANDGYPEGYALIDLYDNGDHEVRYTTYGWNAKAKKQENAPEAHRLRSVGPPCHLCQIECWHQTSPENRAPNSPKGREAACKTNGHQTQRVPETSPGPRSGPHPLEPAAALVQPSARWRWPFAGKQHGRNGLNAKSAQPEPGDSRRCLLSRSQGRFRQVVSQPALIVASVFVTPQNVITLEDSGEASPYAHGRGSRSTNFRSNPPLGPSSRRTPQAIHSDL